MGEEILGTNGAAGMELSTTCWGRVCCPSWADPCSCHPIPWGLAGAQGWAREAKWRIFLVLS